MAHPIPPPPPPAATPPPLPRASRSGLLLFAAYLAIYATFVGVAAFGGRVLGWIPFGGANLAIWWGFALIALPLLLALVYLRLAHRGD